MSGIFVSYRRKGAKAYTDRLVDALQHRFGDAHIFVDTESIAPGLPFPEAIRKAIAGCSVVLVVIGPDWLEMEDAQGRRRLDDPDDWIQQELVAALGSGARVIPVLVGGAAEPTAAALPEPIRKLASLQCFRLADDRAHWRFDVERLIGLIGEIDPGLLPPQPQPGPPVEALRMSRKAIAGVVLGVIVFALVGSEALLDFEDLAAALFLGLGAVILAYAGYRDTGAGKARGRGLAIAGMAIGVLGTLGAIGSFEQASGPEPGVWSEMHSAIEPSSNVAIGPGAPPSIAGTWHDADGNAFYRIAQDGAQFTFEERDRAGSLTATGRGLVQGRTLTFRFATVANSSGSGRYELTADGRSMSGSLVYEQTGEVVYGVIVRAQ